MRYSVEWRDLTGNKFEDKIINVSKKSSQNDEATNEIEIAKERYVSRDNKLLIDQELI